LQGKHNYFFIIENILLLLHNKMLIKMKVLLLFYMINDFILTLNLPDEGYSSVMHTKFDILVYIQAKYPC
jgi:hypothetical protein